jgi:hypothetical protein
MMQVRVAEDSRRYEVTLVYTPTRIANSRYDQADESHTIVLRSTF